MSRPKTPQSNAGVCERSKRDKFQLFSGVFGASDEVLGAIGSGVDFEKRIAKIYQECRDPETIQKAFKELQAELEPDIVNRLTDTKKKLLENVDEEVREKLKMHFEQSKGYLNLITKGR